jgi:hypothetical protein
VSVRRADAWLAGAAAVLAALLGPWWLALAAVAVFALAVHRLARTPGRG